MDTRAILKISMVFHMGVLVWPFTKAVREGPCLFDRGLFKVPLVQSRTYGSLVWTPASESLQTQDNTILNHLQNRGPYFNSSSLKEGKGRYQLHKGARYS